MAMFDAFSRRLDRLRSQVRAVRRAASDVRAQTDQALRTFGIDPSEPRRAAPVIDVGTAQRGRANAASAAVAAVAKAALQGAALAGAAVLLGIALLSLGMFTGAAVLAFVVVTRGLGLHIDWRGPRPA
jgi:hypothetical protein